MDTNSGIVSIDGVMNNVLIVGILLFLFFFLYIISKTGNLSKSFRYSLPVAIVIAAATGVVLFTRSNAVLGVSANQSAQPKNIQIEQSDNENITINWRTDTPVSELLYYGTQQQMTLMAADQHNLDPVQEHTAQISNLQKGVLYNFKIVNGDQTFTNSAEQQFQFVIN